MRYRPRPGPAFLCLAASIAAGCAAPDSGTISTDEAAPSPSTSPAAHAAPAPLPEHPGLAVGDAAPDAALLSPDGKTVHLADLYRQGPVVVVFYRGGWCPYCNTHLRAWTKKVDELRAAGGSLVAISPEKPERMVETDQKIGIGFLTLSDTRLDAARAYHVLFTLDDKTREKYRGFGIDLTSWNSAGTWQLPAPGTFVVDRTGVIRFSDANWDYTIRSNPDRAIEAVRALAR